MMYRLIWWSCLRHLKEPSGFLPFSALNFSSRPNQHGRFFFLFKQYSINNTMKYFM